MFILGALHQGYAAEKPLCKLALSMLGGLLNL